MTVNYISPTELRREVLLASLGAAVRARRAELGLTLRQLSARAAVSERFLVQLEGGSGNISVARLLDVADALGTSPAALLSGADARPKGKLQRHVALVGLRGAGKSTIGSRVAALLDAPFVELDALVARELGMSLATIFEVHGEAYFRRAERAVVERLLAKKEPQVIATSGSIVTHAATWSLVRERATTVWLKASADLHWSRVVSQGDGRPMRDRPAAMTELKALLRARRPLYAMAAHTVDTTSKTIEDAVEEVASVVTRGARER